MWDAQLSCYIVTWRHDLQLTATNFVSSFTSDLCLFLFTFAFSFSSRQNFLGFVTVTTLTRWASKAQFLLSKSLFIYPINTLPDVILASTKKMEQEPESELEGINLEDERHGATLGRFAPFELKEIIGGVLKLMVHPEASPHVLTFIANIQTQDIQHQTQQTW